MRRLLLMLGLSSLLGMAAATGSVGAPGDGSLAVSGGDGTLVVHGHGVIFGYFASGSILVFDYQPDSSGNTISIEGASAHSDAGLTTYSGTDVRFLLPSGRYTIELVATGIDVSAVGRGTLSANASADSSTGSLALDGGRPMSLAKVTSAQSFGAKGP